MKKIGVFCASSNRMDGVYYEEAARLGAWIGETGRTLVYGGANCGLMEAVARAVHEHGGHVMGVVPQILAQRNRVSEYIDTTVHTADLNDRKQMLIEQSDIIVVLPGSVGTLDEVFTVMAANTIGIHEKRLVFWNIHGFWDDLFRLFEGLEQRGAINKPMNELMDRADTLEELIEVIRNA
ncbi:MAG: TIGR00730 family Rossman fold protein [Bacteroidaceae bacterium]|nr:TIGR00730 family Rossman fold protein [Bacteroidaceae bacterium]